MDTYMVTLADREGKDQRVLVNVPSDNTEDDVREFILRPGLKATDGREVELAAPTVIGIRKLHIKRPPFRTVMQTLQKTSA
ncbi:hypothetical protein KHO57_gp224 [Mycobacterium phage Phabba]|uniref:Uncharacterized protein n=1 Tax=Mycobacterium phage Phabba TaxID=2027899 RepID=A0A249XSQ0_9CAUD|nr:hypothetical protein KHO57_gp224 [Mycobacterium phage Phabba]ASZ74680.1 hypothetical protein SEA_PHABBA_111 [Mycobacterium phage Phabba]